MDMDLRTNDDIPIALLNFSRSTALFSVIITLNYTSLIMKAGNPSLAPSSHSIIYLSKLNKTGVNFYLLF